MGCEAGEIINTGFREVIRGEDASLTFFCVKQTGRPFPLTGATELSMAFKNADGTTLTKTLSGTGITLVNAGGGEFAVGLSDAETALLKLLDRDNLLLVADFGSTKRKIRFKKALTVTD